MHLIAHVNYREDNAEIISALACSLKRICTIKYKEDNAQISAAFNMHLREHVKCREMNKYVRLK